VLLWKRGDLRSAVEQVQLGLQTGVALRHRLLVGCAAQAAVALVAARAESSERARLYEAADTMFRATGATDSAYAFERGWQDVVRLRDRLEEAGELAAYSQGRTLPFDEMAALTSQFLKEVAQALPQPKTAPGSAPSPDQPSQPAEHSPLSARETEVLRLVAEGLSSKEIGRRLFLSPSTVNFHLTSVFNKLGVDTRAQAVAVAARRGLL
jgi:DNA-binding CsgD family transcriptional regulator